MVNVLVCSSLFLSPEFNAIMLTTVLTLVMQVKVYEVLMM